jgi:hypothetical protein
MKNLVIKGHATRGNEVIEILEMLGGKNSTKLVGNAPSCGYYIDSDGNIAYHCYSSSYFNDAIQFTIEEFLEVFPYRVGYKIQHKGATSCGSVFVVEKMRWVNNNVEYTIKRLYYNNDYTTCTAKDLQPYKEETMEDKGKLAQIDLANELFVYDKIEVLLGDYEFVLKDGKTYFIKKKPQYPKTYEECCKIIDYYLKGITIIGHKVSLLENFQKLLVCRDAYWKIAGEQMGLGKLWKPDSKNIVHYIYYSMYDNEIQVSCGNLFDNEILAFPTAEMRDAFYENFKNLIEVCKELL